MGSRSGHSKFGLITHGWTCAYMQRNTKRINVNHWMKHSTSEGIDELVTWIEWPPSAWITSNQLETTLEEQLHVVHHTMAVDPMPGAKIPGWPASSRPAGLTFRPIRPNQVGDCSQRRCKKEYWAFDQNSVNPRPVGLTFLCHVLNFAW